MTRNVRWNVRSLWSAGIALLVAAVLLVWWTMVGEDERAGGAEVRAGGSPGELRGKVTVMAAASLTEPFEKLADRLHETYPELKVVLSFGPSSGLVEQVRAGAPADVLATANVTTMDAVVEAGDVAGEPRIFGRNHLVLAVPAANPAGVTSLDDLAREELRIALCEPQVPCGAAAESVLDAAGVRAAPDTLTTDVKDALALVTLGEADAALVYSTDAASAGGDVAVVEDIRTEVVVNDYPVAVLSEAPDPAAAAAVVEAIRGERGQAILAEAGFLEP